ncbi:MAG: hypothetical protein MK236_03615, partial [Pedosphaera sp.]|nr:hypothetical protein [Pedosphaera sp.]
MIRKYFFIEPLKMSVFTKYAIQKGYARRVCEVTCRPKFAAPGPSALLSDDDDNAHSRSFGLIVTPLQALRGMLCG